jgi:type IV secretory pathway TrbL component
MLVLMGAVDSLVPMFMIFFLSMGMTMGMLVGMSVAVTRRGSMFVRVTVVMLMLMRTFHNSSSTWFSELELCLTAPSLDDSAPQFCRINTTI